jgi:hypothetical protein
VSALLAWIYLPLCIVAILMMMFIVGMLIIESRFYRMWGWLTFGVIAEIVLAGMLCFGMYMMLVN